MYTPVDASDYACAHGLCGGYACVPVCVHAHEGRRMINLQIDASIQ